MKKISYYKNIIVVVIIALFCGGAIAYADFVRTTGSSSGFGYGYGYGYEDGWGYGYGYNTAYIGVTDKEQYGFFGSDGAVTSHSAAAASCTTATITYTSDYLAEHRVAYGISSVSENATSLTGFETDGSISLTGLTASTTYIYRVGSVDAGGNSWPSSQGSFTTPACSSGGGGGSYNPFVPPVTPPSYGSGVVGNHFIFKHDIRFNVTDTDTIELQRYLNRIGFLVAAAGRPGSPGNETNFFGSATRAALARFQAANGITPPAGFFGPITREFINSGTNSSSETNNSSTFKFTKDLQFNVNDPQVKELQKRLNSLGFTVAVSGPGSLGNETVYFGAATRAALVKYQISKGITPAVGYFGPATRASMNNQ